MGFHRDTKLTLQTVHRQSSCYGLCGTEREKEGYKEEENTFSPLGVYANLSDLTAI